VSLQERVGSRYFNADARTEMTPATHSVQPITEDTLKDLKALLDKATPERWETFKAPFSRGEYLAISSDWSKDERKFCISQQVWNCSDEDILLITMLRNGGAELLRGYRLGIALDKDQKP